jgi:hypothetical protein
LSHLRSALQELVLRSFGLGFSRRRSACFSFAFFVLRARCHFPRARSISRSARRRQLSRAAVFRAAWFGPDSIRFACSVSSAGFLDFLRASLSSISSGATGFGSCRLGVDFLHRVLSLLLARRELFSGHCVRSASDGRSCVRFSVPVRSPRHDRFPVCRCCLTFFLKDSLLDLVGEEIDSNARILLCSAVRVLGL